MTWEPGRVPRRTADRLQLAFAFALIAPTDATSIAAVLFVDVTQPCARDWPAFQLAVGNLAG